MRPIPRALAALLVLLLAALLLAAGCGGGGDDEDMTAGLTPAELLTRSAEAASQLQSLRVEFEATGTIELSGEASQGGLLNGPIDISGEGPVEIPDKASIDTRVRLAGLPLQVNLTRVGEQLFLGALGQDIRLDVPPEQVALLDFGSLFPTLARWISDPQEAGREEVGGTETVKVTGQIDPQRALTDLAPLLGSSAPSAADARAALRRGTIEAWIGTSDLRPRRIHLVLDADGSRISPDVGAVSVDLTVDLSAFDEPVEIATPRASRTLGLDELGSLIGG